MLLQEPKRRQIRHKKALVTRPSRSRRRRKNRILQVVMLTVIVCLIVLGFVFRFYILDQLNHSTTKMTAFERSLDHLRAAVHVDSERQYHIQRVLTLIERYNIKMAPEKRFEIADEIYRMSVKYPNLNVDLICATITQESALTWRPNIQSQAGAMGLMQVMPGTAVFLTIDEGIPWTSAEEILYNPILNIRLGCRYLSTLISMYGLEGGLIAYNGGEKRAALWLASGKDDSLLWAETRGYVPAVMKLYQEFQN